MAGMREGYAFKKGPQGVGYYEDAAAAAREQLREPPPAVPAALAPADAGAAPVDHDGGDGLLMQPLEGTGHCGSSTSNHNRNAEPSPFTMHNHAPTALCCRVSVPVSSGDCW